MHGWVAEAREGVEGVVEGVRERGEELEGLAGRLGVGMEEWVSGELVGLDARWACWSWWGHGVTKEGIGEVRRVVAEEMEWVEEQLEDIGESRQVLGEIGRKLDVSGDGR